MSVFILSGAELKATARLEGPIAPASVEDPEELYRLDQKFRSPGAPMNVNELVDFEHMNESDDEEEESSEDTDEIDPDDPDANEKKRARRQKQREKFLEVKRQKERRRISQHKRILKDGDPFIITARAPEAGWYRACVEGTWHQVRALIRSFQCLWNQQASTRHNLLHQQTLTPFVCTHRSLPSLKCGKRVGWEALAKTDM